MKTLILCVTAIICIFSISCAKENGGKMSTPSVENVKWTLVSQKAKAIMKSKQLASPTLYLDTEKQKAYGTGGCNRYTAPYAVDGSQITFGPISATKMACSKTDRSEITFFSALKKVKQFEYSEGQLTLLGTENTALVFQK